MINPNTNVYPLSYGQQGIWLHQQQAPHSVAYHAGIAMRILSEVNLDALRQTFQTIINRQAALRTIVYLKDGQPVQQIVEEQSVTLTQIDAAGWDEERLRAEVMQTHRLPYDFAQGPLFRVYLFTQSPEKHVLLMGAHHLVMDAESWWHLLDEVRKLYAWRAFCEGHLPELPKVARTYTDYVAHERELLQRKGEKLGAFWQSRLSDVPPTLDLPTDHARPPIRQFNGSSEFFALSSELTAELKALAKQEKVTLTMLLLAGFQILLHRYSQQDRFVVGVPSTIKPGPAFESTVGDFINVLPLCADLSENPTVKELFRQVFRTMMMGLRRAYPFSLLVQELQIPHNPSTSPVVQVLFNFPQPTPELAPFLITVPGEKESTQPIAWGGLSVAPFGLPQQEGGFDLTLNIVQGTEKCFGALLYNSDLFQAKTIQRMIGHFRTLLQEIVLNPEQRVAQLPILTEAERHQLLVEWNDTAVDFGEPQTIHALFEQQVERTPEAVALVFDDKQLTYAELNARANQLAHHLIELGVQPDTLVAVAMERSLEMVVALLAVLKAGGAYLPIDPTYPSKRIRDMLTDSAAPILLTQSHLEFCHDTDTEHVIAVDRVGAQLALRAVQNPQTRTTAHHLAYVIYTSGSTGQPKGVLIEHGGAFNVASAQAKLLPDLMTGSRLLQLASLGFDAATFEVMMALMHGVTLVITPAYHERLGMPLVEFLSRQRITHALLVPSVLQTWPAPVDLPDLKVLITAGEACPNDLVNRWAGGRAFFNFYGPTESPIWTTYAALQPDQVVHIGQPIPNRRVYILSDNAAIVPVGVPGELYIGGEYLARGYLNRPDLTAERFIEHPEFGRLYKTGDLCRWLPDGNISYIGRTDFQVKIRGFRIELGEIEAHLSQQAMVREAVVVVDENVSGKRLVAYIVSDIGADVAELRDQLSRSLPNYMIPSAFVALETMPLTPNGKIDRRALPQPSYADAQTAFVAPRHALEQQLADIWADILGVEQVGIHDNFFALGGHSLLAIQVVSQVRAQLNLEVPLATLFSSSQLAAFADVISQAPKSTTAIRKAERGGPLPLSFAQQRLWFLDQLEPNSAFYNIPTVIRLAGQLDVLALEQSFSYLIGRHESLRTTFGAADGEPMQVIDEPEPFILKVIVVDGEEQAQQLALAEASTPFDLRKGPLLRVQLLKYASSNPQTPRGHRHLLLLTMHHIISDAWSTRLLIEELTHAYAAYAPRGGVQGNVPTLPQLPIEYADFALWQREILAGETSSRQLSFWRSELIGAPALLELPTDRPRPPLLSYRGAHYTFQLDGDLTAKLNQLAQSSDATLFMVVLSAFNVLLSRYSRQTDIVVGTPIANRNRAEIEGLIGFFVNTLAIRTQLDDNPSFAELLKKVRQTTLAAYEHQDLPFEQLVDELQPQRSLSYTPLFQVMLVLENREMRSFALPDPVSRETSLSATMGLTELPFAKFDLTLFLLPSDEGLGASQGLRGMFEYSTDLFDEATIARMASHFELLLKSIVAHPDKPVLQLPMLTEAEYHQIVHEFNDTVVDFGDPLGTIPLGQTIHALFSEQVERTPDAVALIFADEQLTYAELNARANQLAHYLRENGVMTETPVGVCLNRHFDLIISTLAIIKAGGAYVPLDPTYPRHRLQFMVRDTGLRLILTEGDLIERVPVDAQLVDVKRLDLRHYPPLSPSVNITSDNLLYIMYTSGSTGQPKGIEILHRNVQRLVKGANFAKLDATQTFLQLASPSFDASTLEIWGSLCNGARLVLYPEQVIDLRRVGQLIQTHQISILWLTAGLFHQMVDHHLEALSGVRQLLAGGDVLSVAHICRLLKSASKELTLINGYGPTENTTFTTTYRITELNPQARSVPIGVPISNTQVYILDQAQHLTPIGVPGELYAGGLGVARGYLKRPELTDERFIEHPQFGRLYKTGDLCRWLPDGNPSTGSGHRIEFMGRTDFQVKIRGFRIELGEIESTLLAQNDVREVVVLARDAERNLGDKRLVAYVVGDADSDALRTKIAQRLPDYMVPSAFVRLDAMPLTPNGKLDRRALPAPNYFEAQTHYVAPRNALEQQLADIWADVLGIEQVGIHDDFFALGGHSLLATQVISRVRAAVNLEVPLKTLFETSQLAAFAHQIGQTQERSAATIQKRPEGTLRDGQLPLSFAQQRLWFLDQLEPESALYNIPLMIRLEGELDVAALEQSFSYLMARHESLRTTFDRTDGEPMQVIHEPSPFRLSLIAVDDEQQAQQLGQVEASTPFNLRKGPLLRLQLLKTTDTLHFLLLNMHHIISDGWSMGLLLEELTHAYTVYVQGNVPTLPELPIQYADFAVWQRDYLSDETLDRQLSFWRQQLTGAPPQLDLPTDRLRPPVRMFRGAHYTFHLNGDLTAKLNQLAQSSDATLFMVLLSAFNVLLSRYSRQTDIVIGTPIANRNRAETEGLIGFFVNTLALRTQLDDNPSFTVLLNRVRSRTLAAYEHQDLPFEQLVDELELTRTLSVSPLFQVMFALQNAEMGLFGLSGVRATMTLPEFPFAKFDLTLSLIPSDEGLGTSQGLRGMLEYRTDLFDEATMARMANHFEVLLNGIVAHPDKPVLQLPLLTEAEYHQIVHQWNDTAVDFGEPQTIHAMFEQQVERTPNAVALIFEDQQLTYSELNARANQLAHHLIECGVQADTLVAVAIPRSLEMIVSLLAVLKAGGAYVPIDPSYPSTRIRYMLTDSAAPILLTQSHLESIAPWLFSVESEHVIAVERVEEQLAFRPTHNPQTRTKPEHLAYVIYTSGSTGQPKGVLIEHSGAFNVAIAQCKVLPGLMTGSRLLQLASLSFDAATFEVIMALLHGVTLVVPKAHDRLGLPLADLLRSQRITHALLVPSVLQILPIIDLPDLKVIITAGEACSSELVNRWANGRTFLNLYGPTESPIWTTYATLEEGKAVHIGQPIPNRRVYILSDTYQIVPVGVAGELYIGGDGLARGYLKRPELTAERFIEHPQFGRLYKTGDLCRWLPDGNIEFIGRTDFQVKIRGFRIELGEIESVLLAADGVREAYVLAREDNLGQKSLVAYLVGDGQSVPFGDSDFDTDTLRQHLAQHLPDYMVPAAFVLLSALPLTPNGKVDRKALPAPEMRRQGQASYVTAQSDLQQILIEIWQEELNLEQASPDGGGISIHDNFFDIGGHSLLLVKVHSRLKELIDQPLAVVDLFRYPTIHALSAHLEPSPEQQPDSSTPAVQQLNTGQQAIAIVGMAGRFPGADSIETLWQNLSEGVESVTFFSDQELLAAGVKPDLLADPAYVKAGAPLSDIEHFDADFFGFASREAALLDPQIRLFLECAWQALEHAGCDPQRYQGQIGVFAGSGENSYMENNLRPALDDSSSANLYQASTLNGKDFLATRVSYKLNLTGPAVTVQTACSTSLVATHMACQSLRHGECDIALAGGVSVRTPVKMGYLYQEGMILSPDGHCRAFDVASEGTFGGSGVGIVVLKRLQDALDEGDLIHAVIKGSAINNDGSNKVGYTAPSVDGQASVIRQALANANVTPDTISYVETHGTGTKLGDPIELTALKEVFQTRLAQPELMPIVLGAVKTNFGHLDAAAGVTGLIKSALALKHQAIPPTLHFTEPNPELNLEAALFEINTQLMPWSSRSNDNTGRARRAGVSSFGIGGTNAHAVLEEAPAQPAIINNLKRSHHLLTLSAKSEQALREMAAEYAAFLASTTDESWGDICYTTHVGRRHFAHRLSLVGKATQQMDRHASVAQKLAAYLAGEEKRGVSQGVLDKKNSAPKVAFLFTGQGALYVGMGQELYETEPAFRATLERCDDIFQTCLGRSLLELLYPADAPAHNELIDSPPCGQAAQFALQCALVELWRSWGVEPDLVMGHSLGDFAAAYTAGVLSLDDGLWLMTERGRLMESALGSMVSVMASEAEVMPFLVAYDNVTIGVINGPRSVVISGEERQVEEVATQLQAAGFKTRQLAIPVATHSAMLNPILDDFTQTVRRLSLSQPNLPVVSSMTGQLVHDELTDPNYWRQHLRNTVRFADGIQTLQNQGATIYLEIGPKPTLLGIVEQLKSADAETDSIPAPILLPTLRENQSDWQQMLSSLGQLYTLGVAIDWTGFDKDYQRRKVELPTYPFQRQRYWIDAPKMARHASVAQHPAGKKGSNDSLRPLIDKMVHAPVLNTTIFETVFSLERLPFLADYRILHTIVSPAATHLALLLDAAALALDGRPFVLEDVTFPAPLLMPEEGQRTVQLLVTTNQESNQKRNQKRFSGEGFGFNLVSFDGHKKKPLITSHAMGQLRALPVPVVGAVLPETVMLDELRQRCAEEVDLEAFYRASAADGITIGATLRWLTNLWRGEGEALGKLAVPDILDDISGYRVHPGLLNSCFAVTAPLRQETTEPLLPDATLAWRAIRTLKFYQDFYQDPNGQHRNSDEWWCHARQSSEKSWDIQLLNRGGEVLIELEGVELRPAKLELIPDQHEAEAWRQWLYDVRWQPLALTMQDQGSLLSQAQEEANQTERQWLLFADDAPRKRGGGASEVLARHLHHSADDAPGKRGEVIFVHQGAAYEQKSAQRFTIRPDHADDYRQLIAALPNVTDVVHCWSLNAPLVNDATENANELKRVASQSCGTTLHLTQALLHERLTPPRLWLVTCGAQALSHDTHDNGHHNAHIAGFAQAALWGMAKTIGLEHPELNCVCIDLDETIELVTQMPTLCAAITKADVRQKGENQLALRKGHCYVPRLTRYEHVPTEMAIHSDATYLITGGLGGLGLELAHWLVEQGATQLILMGRSQPTPEAQAKVDAICAMGAQVQVARADVRDQAQVAALLAEIPPAYPLRGIIHAAGVLDDGALLQQTWERFDNVLGAKVWGTWHLHRLTQHLPLDFFVLFSSATGLLGNPGQTNYAAANAFMDALAHYRHTQGLAALSINWAGWTGVGTALKMQEQAAARRDLPTRGFSRMQAYRGYSPQEGLEAFGKLLNQPVAQIACMSIDWHHYLDDITSRIPFYTALAQEARAEASRETSRQRSRQTGASQAGLSQTVDASLIIYEQLQRLSAQEQASLLTQKVQSEVGRLLGIDSPHQIDTQMSIINLGMDSLMAIELRNRMQKMLKIKIPVAKFLEGINLAETVQFLLRQFNHETMQNKSIETTLMQHQTKIENQKSKIENRKGEPAKVKEILI